MVTADSRPRWRRRLSVAVKRSRFVPLIEIGTVLALLGIAAISYFIIARQGTPQSPLTPPLVAGLLVANLLPAIGLMVLVARRVAKRRAARSLIGGRGRLHVRLVALFSAIAAVPTLLVVIFASLLFQMGTDFWTSNRARGMMENTAAIARQGFTQELDRVDRETVTMASDVGGYLSQVKLDDPEFINAFANQVLVRNLSEAVMFSVGADGEIRSLALVDPYDRPLGSDITPSAIKALRAGKPSVTNVNKDRIGTVTALPINGLYLYAARAFDPELRNQFERAGAVLADYNALLDRSRVLQFRFNLALFLISLLIVGVAILIALKLADRLVRPVGELVDAARRVTAGDLSTRVPAQRVNDEVGTLGNAFNRMTRRLEEQTGALVTANSQLDSRRSFIEAVLSGVTAGVISVDRDRNIRLINSSAEDLLKIGQSAAMGQPLRRLAPELDAQLDSNEREDIIQFASGGEPRTLAVKRVKVEGGHVITFDDITDQLLGPAPRGVVGRRTKDRARDQEPADADPARCRAPPAPLRQGDRVRPGDVRTADPDHRPAGRRPAPHGRRIFVLRPHAQAGLPRRADRRDRPACFVSARSRPSRHPLQPGRSRAFAADGLRPSTARPGVDQRRQERRRGDRAEARRRAKRGRRAHRHSRPRGGERL
jgi:two-component system nitrogen regulation sensor histidine kinase NtrY